MRKKMIIALSSTVLVSIFSVTVFADGNTTTKTIGNLVYEIPADWSVVSTDDTDDYVTITYNDGIAALVVSYMSLDFDMDNLDESIQRVMLDAPMQSFETSDNYSEFGNEDCLFEGKVANTKIFSYDSNGENYTTMSYTVYTGEGIGMFVYGGPTSTMENTGFDALVDISESVKTTDSSVNTDSEDGEKYTKYGSGMYKIGTDLPAGEYIVFTENNRGYFCVSSDSNQSDITFNDNFDYNSIITVNDGEYLELSKCYAIPSGENPEVDLSGSGMFKVGVHIPAGEYKLETTEGHGYYCIYSDSRQDKIIANDNFDAQNYVTVSEGQYLILSGCKFLETPAKPMKSYTDSDTVIKVQEALNAAGYDCGIPDGIAGSGTTAQIQRYQTDKGLTVTGTVTDELIQSLGI